MPASVYGSVQQVEALGVDAVSADIVDALATSSRWVDAVTDQRRFGFGAPAVATVTVRDAAGPTVALEVPLALVTAVLVNGVAQTDLTGWLVEGVDSRLLVFAPNGIRQPITRGILGGSWGAAPTLTVTGTWGYPDIPALVARASVLYAAHQLGVSPTFGQVSRETMGAVSFSYDMGATLADLAVQALADGGYLTAIAA